MNENFQNSSNEVKRKIFSYIGENYQLNGKKLNIIKPDWLQSIEEKKKAVEAEIYRWELEKYVDLPTWQEYFGDMFPVLLGD